ncbi:bifunctional 3-phenylpropionate/cinnamic acid dioxygenase ferredoxin subunit [Streptomyces spiramyceticus]|uniref:bifunctional 3-phenylpropionate/cinnamic acid dioxygenase ferredoxin subunit n=1 Tax=Streptomyces spiramyceticus TaxID=299717 RepID=UPI00237B3AD5|nr:bifunctional 3-phenylpropionate/cinnamic acid dioxygenase ferredoxin subunit [Streptomyces spiramyceticus]
MIPVCHLDDLPEGESVRVPTEPPIAVFRTEEALYAIDDTCSHQDASLSEGWLEGCLVECPLHAAMFDLRTGQPTCLPARRPVRTHRVSVDDSGFVHVEVAAGAAGAAGTAAAVAAARAVGEGVSA